MPAPAFAAIDSRRWASRAPRSNVLERHLARHHDVAGGQPAVDGQHRPGDGRRVVGFGDAGLGAGLDVPRREEDVEQQRQGQNEKEFQTFSERVRNVVDYRDTFAWVLIFW